VDGVGGSLPTGAASLSEELAVAVSDIGQAPKVEDLARSEGAGHDEELTGEADTAV